MKKLIAIATCLLFVITGCNSKEDSQVKKVTSDEVIELLKEDAILLDVRSESEYNEGHIPESILLNVSDVEDKIKGISSDYDQAIIVYCRSGNRSAKAAQTLIDMGYHNVYDLGGITNWEYEIEK